MPHVIEKTVFKFDELTDSAKEKARDWFRSIDSEFDAECTLDDAATIADLFGLDIRMNQVRLMNGENAWRPSIYYSGFSSQGDGACFKGRYKYKAGGLRAVKECAPKDEELHRIVKALQSLQSRRFYRLTASTKQSGHYYHSGCMTVDVEDENNPYSGVSEDVYEGVRDELRYFADWIYKRLEAEYEWSQSDEVVDGNIEANEYDFNEDGTRSRF